MADPKDLMDAHVVGPLRRKTASSYRFDRRLAITLVQWNAKGWEDRCQAKGVSWCAAARVDGHEVARTQPLEELKPYWDQPFQVVIPDDLSLVSVYLHELAKGMDKPVAKVDVPKQRLLEAASIDEWLPLMTMSEETDITGRLNVDVELYQDPSDNKWSCKVVVVEGAGFPHTGLYVRVTLEQNAISGESNHLPETAHISSEDVRRSKVFRREMDPMWCESFEFHSPQALATTKVVDGELQWARGVSPVVRISAWREDGDGKHVYSGATVVPISEKHLVEERKQLLQQLREHSPDVKAGFPLAEWFALQRSPLLADTDEPLPMGDMRVKLAFSELSLLPQPKYKPLVSMLMSCLEAPDIVTTPVGLLAAAARNKELLAKHLLHFYIKQGAAFTFITKLVDSEVAACKESPTLFRGNTLTTKVIDTYMKLLGKELLIVWLSPVVLSKVIKQHLELEVNPAVLSNPVKLKDNAAQLEQLIGEIMNRLLDNVAYCPPNLQHVFHYVAQAATDRFPDEGDTVRWTAISGFAFLRFIAPAILNPHLFGLCHSQPSAGVRRTLVLISKAIQTLGNLGGERNVKEDFMRDLLHRLDETHKNRTRIFLDKISCKPSTSPNADIPEYATVNIPNDDHVIKEGYLVKRGQGRKVASVMGVSVNGLKNMKRRYFRLSPAYLSYHKSEDEPALDKIAKGDILGVERVDGEALGYPYAFQIIRKDAILYLVAESAFELQEWVTTLREFCSTNRTLASAYHPGVVTSKGVWSCCKHPSEADGCHPCVKVRSSKYPRVKTALWEDPVTCQESIFQFLRTALEKKGSGDAEDELATARAQAQDVCTALEGAHQQQRRPTSRPGSKYNPILS